VTQSIFFRTDRDGFKKELGNRYGLFFSSGWGELYDVRRDSGSVVEKKRYKGKTSEKKQGGKIDGTEKFKWS